MSLAGLLSIARERLGIGRQRAHKRTGVHYSQIKRYEDGTSPPTLASLENLMDGYGGTWTRKDGKWSWEPGE